MGRLKKPSFETVMSLAYMVIFLVTIFSILHLYITTSDKIENMDQSVSKGIFRFVFAMAALQSAVTGAFAIMITSIVLANTDKILKEIKKNEKKPCENCKKPKC